jgi:hypothetical protein
MPRFGGVPLEIERTLLPVWVWVSFFRFSGAWRGSLFSKDSEFFMFPEATIMAWTELLH